MQLIYRSQTIEFTPSATSSQHKSYVINWRFQIPGKSYNVSPTATRGYYQSPRTIN